MNCTSCGDEWTRPRDHNCGRVTITKDRLRSLLEAERERDDYRASLEYIRDHGKTHDRPCWALHQGDCAEVMQEVARKVLNA